MRIKDTPEPKVQVEPLQLPDDLARSLYNGEKDRELHRFVYLSHVRPNAKDIGQVIIVKVTGHLFARDLIDALRKLQANIPTEYPMLLLTELHPVGGVGEDTMLEVSNVGEGDPGPVMSGLAKTH